MLLCRCMAKKGVPNRYRLLGLSLCVAGAVFAPLAYFIIGSVPLTAMGTSAIMLGFTSAVLASTRPGLSPEACQLMFRTGMENTGALIEELGLTSPAIYLPSGMFDSKSGRVLIPLDAGSALPELKTKLPGRLVIRYGSRPEDIGIAVAAPGNINLAALETPPGASPDDIEAAASHILIGLLDIAASVRVSLDDRQLDFEVTGADLPCENVRYYRCLGSPVASILAAIASESLRKPVRIKEEKYARNRGRIILEVVPCECTTGT